MSMDGTETLISHLIELRDRLLKAVIAWIVLFVCLFPWASDLYAVLAQPLIDKLPQGGQMIATEVVTPFFVPIKVAMDASFVNDAKIWTRSKPRRWNSSRAEAWASWGALMWDQ